MLMALAKTSVNPVLQQTSYSTKSDFQSKNALKGVRCLAIIVALPNRIPFYSCNHSPAYSSQSLHNHNSRISYEKPEEPRYLTVNLSHKERGEGRGEETTK
jgi:hypothetical protein